MASFCRRVKRVTDPLDDRVKAQLIGVGYFNGERERSSSSAFAGGDSPCLSEPVHSFLEDNHDNTEGTGSGTFTYDTDCIDSNLDDATSLEIVVKSTTVGDTDSHGNLLVADVSKTMEMLSFFKTDKAIFRRKMMAYLHKARYNAGICMTKWSSSTGITAESYDVVQSISSIWQNMYFIDLNFASEFEIAVPTKEYSSLLQYYPKVFVGKGKELTQVERAMSYMAKRSLKSEQLSLMEKKPLHAKEMVRFVLQNNESSSGKLRFTH